MATTTGTAYWGVKGEASDPDGIVTGITHEKTPSLAPEYNEIGQVVKQTLYDEQESATATIEVAEGVALPDVNDSITINGVQGYVTRCRLVESNRAYRLIEVTVERYKNCNSVTDKRSG